MAPDQRGYSASDKPRGVASLRPRRPGRRRGRPDRRRRPRAGHRDRPRLGRGRRLGGDLPSPVAVRPGGDPQRPPPRRHAPGAEGEPPAASQELVHPVLPASQAARKHSSAGPISAGLVNAMTRSSRPGTFTPADFERYKAGLVRARRLDLDGPLVSGRLPDQARPLPRPARPGADPDHLGGEGPIPRGRRRPVELRPLRVGATSNGSKRRRTGSSTRSRTGQSADPRLPQRVGWFEPRARPTTF